MGSSYIGRQPIVNAWGQVFAYDLHYPRTKSAPKPIIRETMEKVNQ